MTDDYIKRRKAQEEVKEAIRIVAVHPNDKPPSQEATDIFLKCMSAINNIPSADVVEVVRCKDCKHYKRNIPCVGGHYNGCDEWLDEGNAITVYDNDYCSYGEKRDD